MEDKPVIDLSTTVAPGETVAVSHQFDKSGFITHLHARAYPGEETSVQRNFRLWRGGRDEGNPVSLIRSPEGANDALVGDNQTWDFAMRREFEQDDVLEVSYQNTGNYTYPVSTVVAIDYDRGLIERLGGLL